jgi:hypothetical protein
MKKTLVLSTAIFTLAVSAAVEIYFPQARPAALVETAKLSLADLSGANTVHTESYLHLPLSFERNEGQTDPQVKFLSRGSGYTLYLIPTEALLSLRNPSAEESCR